MKLQVRLLFFFSACIVQLLFAQNIDRGVVDLTSIENRGKPMALIGEATLYWKQFLSLRDLDTATPSASMHIPGVWDNVVVNGKRLDELGYGTLVVKVVADSIARQKMAIYLTPIFCSYRLYVDSTLIVQCGDPQKRAETTINRLAPVFANFSFSGDTGTLIFHMANYANNQGGPWQLIHVGEQGPITRFYHYLQAYDFFLLGGLLAFSLTYFFVFLLMKYDSRRNITLWFSLYTFLLFVRLLETGTHTFYLLAPSIPDSFIRHLDFLTFFLSALFYQSYIHNLFIETSSKIVMRGFRYLTVALSTFSLLTPLIIHSETVVFFQVVLLLLLCYHMVLSIQTFTTSRGKSSVLFAGTLVLLGAVGHDILQCYGYGLSLTLVPVSGVIVALIHSLYLGYHTHQIFVEREQYAGKLAAVTSTMSKFIPEQFFKLQDQTPLTIALGSQIRKKMSVAFCSMRNFAEISRDLSSDEKFDLVSSFHQEVGPIFARYGGFIDKYIGDSIMAIFPDKPDEAMKAALELLTHFHSVHLSSSCASIKLGIGIHYGQMTLGVIGSEDRMENTVIGDAVNTAARMQSLSQKFGADLIVSNEVLSGGRFENETFHLRSLGTLAVKGKRERTTIQEVFYVKDGEHPAKLETRNLFEQGVVFYEAGQFEQAKELFGYALAISPEDTAAQAFFTSCSNGGTQILTSK